MIWAALSGILLALAYPKFNLFWLAWVALVPLFIALSRSRSKKESIILASVFGLIFFGLHLTWVTTLTRFAGAWACLGWFSFVIYQTLFVVAAVLLSRKHWHIPFLWVAAEWIRNLGFLGAAATEIGYSQAPLLPVIQIASLVSVYGVSFLVLFVNLGLAEFILKRDKSFLRMGLVMLVAVLIFGYVSLSEKPIAGRVLKVALIQPNIDQLKKMDSSSAGPNFDLLESLTRQAAKAKPEIIIWPETAILAYTVQDARFKPRLEALARETGCWLILGTAYYEKGKPYNSIVSISPQGELFSRYDKQRLVPFGEYLPWRGTLYPLLKSIGYYDNQYYPNGKSGLIRAAGISIAPAVCFESTFPASVRGKGEFILTVTNDGWFGDSAALYHHLGAGIFRAVENRKYFVQVGNTGITAVIDPYGRVAARAKVNEEQILFFEIPLAQN